MSATVYLYDVEIAYTSPDGKKTRTSEQWAYNVLDACQQAVMNMSYELPEAREARVVRVAPARANILEQYRRNEAAMPDLATHNPKKNTET